MTYYLAVKQLIIIRHGQAVDTTDSGDHGRWLDQTGRQQVRLTANALQEAEAIPTMVFCSPLVRAVQTAELITSALRINETVRTTAKLIPSASVGELLDHMKHAETEKCNDNMCIALISHQPLVSQLATIISGTPVSGFSVASACLLQLHRWQPSGAQLRWRWTPKKGFSYI